MTDNLPNLAQAFMNAVENAATSGELTDRFTKNPAMAGMSLLHTLRIVTEEIQRQLPNCNPV